VPTINGTRLTELVAAFESARHFEPVGGYAGIVPEHFEFGSLDRYFMGQIEPDSSWVGLSGIWVLGCDCGEVGCWPLQCRVTPGQETVVWHEFSQPHRPGRDHSQFGPFVFEAEQYRGAVKKLQTEYSAFANRLA